jgi:hypothetical protein
MPQIPNAHDTNDVLGLGVCPLAHAYTVRLPAPKREHVDFAGQWDIDGRSIKDRRAVMLL